MAIVVVLAVLAVDFAMYPYGSKSEVSWHDFRQQERLDTVCLGTSLALRSYNPEAIDTALHSNSFNMSTPGQTVHESVLGLKEAAAHHDIKRVFYGVDFWTLCTEHDQGPRGVYLREKWKGAPLGQRAADLAYILPDSRWPFTEKSLNWVFPWTEQHANFDLVAENVRMKMEKTPVAEASERIERGWNYFGRGYGNYYGVLDYNVDHLNTYADIDMRPLLPEDLSALEHLCTFCEQRGIDLVVYVPPLSNVNLVCLKDLYAGYDREVRALVTAHGGSYYDFNLAKPELFESKERYFEDPEHLNVNGANAFCESLVRLMTWRGEGRDVNALFQSYDERLAGMRTIASANVKSKVVDRGLRLSASCLAGSQVQPEYQFLVAGEDGNFKVVQDYSAADTCDCQPQSQGVICVRVNVRQRGSHAEYEKHNQHRLVYMQPAA